MTSGTPPSNTFKETPASEHHTFYIIVRYKTIKRQNIYQLRDLDLEVTGDVICLLGANGSGKSNLLLSLGENITGDFHQDKDRIPTWGTDKGVMDDTLLMPDGRTMRIRREFPSGKASLWIGTDDPITGAAKVNARILELLGVDKAVLKNLVFVGQTDITEILFARDSIKDRLAQDFFGLEDANIIEKALAARNSSLVFSDSTTQLTIYRDRKRVTSGRLVELRRRLAEIGQVNPDEITLLETRIAEVSETNSKVTTLKVLDAAAERMAAEIKPLQDRHDADSAAVAKIQGDQIESLLAKAQTAAEQNSSIRRLDASINSSLDRIGQLGQAPCEQSTIDGLDEQIELLNLQEVGLAQRRSQTDGILKGMAKDPICPTCGQAVDLSRRDPLLKEIDEMARQIAALQQERSPLIVRRNTLRSSLGSWTQQVTSLNGGLTMARNERAKYGELHVPEPDVARLQQMKSDYRSLVDRVANQEELLRRLNANLDANAKQRQAFSSSYRTADGQYVAVVDLQPFQTRVEKLRREFLESQSLSSELAVAESNLAATEARIKEIEKDALENKIQGTFQRALVSLRGAFHPDGAPRVLVGRNTQKMTSGINRFLGQLAAKFRVMAKDGLNFDCQFPGGIARDRELSVGQKTALAWAFRFSSVETFSSSVGLMTLDEPTAPLDDEVCECFNQIVEGLKLMAKRHGMQFFVSTHDRELSRHCDQIIQLTSETE